MVSGVGSGERHASAIGRSLGMGYVSSSKNLVCCAEPIGEMVGASR